jgi:uncharacterized protein (DUF1919 family)
LEDGIELHFMHYASEAEAREKWLRRRDRMSWDPDRMFVKFDDGDIGSGLEVQGLLRDFDALPYSRKVCFLAQRRPEIRCSVWIEELKNSSHVMDGNRLYKVCQKYFNVTDWLNGGDGRISRWQGLWNYIWKYKVKALR